MSDQQRIAVIMAGGSGERFWPLSRRARPKQLLRLTHPTRTMLAEAVERLCGLFSADRIFVVTSRALVEPIRAAEVGVPPENVLGEPERRNTTGCLLYAAAEIMARRGEGGEKGVTMAIVTADHAISDHRAYRATIEAAMKAAERHGALATIGIPPTRPETGYGYIEIGDGARPVESQAGLSQAWPVASFHEKPNAANAARFVASGRFFWNSGLFFWPLDTFMDEMGHANRVLALAAREMAEQLRQGNFEEVDRVFAALPDLSIDYALMEKARKVVMVRAAFAWDDIGAWDALDRTFEHDDAGNVVVGDPVLIDVRDSIVYNEPGAEKMAVTVVGVEGLAVVVSPDGVLVVPKNRAQDVKRAVEALKARKASQL